MSEPKSKSFEISKRVVFEAYRRVKANEGAAGVDEESLLVRALTFRIATLHLLDVWDSALAERHGPVVDAIVASAAG
jgi:hypothetical protein